MRLVHARRIVTTLLFAGVVLAGMGGMRANAREDAAYSRASRPVLAFYYTWYHPDTWCRCTMSDLPATRYDSSDVGYMR